jgi:hypothetical protein
VRNGEAFTPTLQELLKSDLVVVSGLNGWGDPVAAGNVLADYVDAGGKLLLLDAALSEGAWGLQGRILGPDYSPVAKAGPGGEGVSASFEDDPVVEGVSYVQSRYTMAAAAVQGSAKPLGRYDNGYLLGAYNADRPVVFLNFQPVEGDYQGGPPIDRLVANVIDHMQGIWNWLKVPDPVPPSPYNYTLGPGESVQVPVIIGHRKSLAEGVYYGYIEFGENVAGSLRKVPVSLTIRNALAGGN